MIYAKKIHNRSKKLKRSWSAAEKMRQKKPVKSAKPRAITLSAINKLNIPRAQNPLMNFDSSHLGFEIGRVQENKQIIAIAEISITFLSPIQSQNITKQIKSVAK